MKEFYKHKCSDKVKWGFTLVAFILICIMLVGLCLQIFATDDKHKPSEWFKPKEEEQQEEQQENGGMVTGANSIVENGIVLASVNIPRVHYDEYDISPLAENAQQLTATIEPGNATNKKVDWTVSWKNANSTFAKGKNVSEYVTATATSDGALTANVTCLKAFGEQIIVTCTSRENSDLSATCTLDYVKRVQNVQIVLSGSGVSNAANVYTLPCKASVTVSYKVTYSDGTLTGTFAGGEITTKLVDDLFNHCKNAVGTVSGGTVVTYHQSTTSFVPANLSGNTTTKTVTVGDSLMFITVDGGGDKASYRNKWTTSFYDYCDSHNTSSDVHAELTMPYNYSYQGTHGQNGTAKCQIHFSLSSLEIAASSISLNVANIKF